MPKNRALTVVLGASLIVLVGCSDGVTIYEAGVYKGQEDPAASEEAAERRAGPLRERAQQAHTDR